MSTYELFIECEDSLLYSFLRAIKKLSRGSCNGTACLDPLEQVSHLFGRSLLTKACDFV